MANNLLSDMASSAIGFAREQKQRSDARKQYEYQVKQDLKKIEQDFDYQCRHEAEGFITISTSQAERIATHLNSDDFPTTKMGLKKEAALLAALIQKPIREDIGIIRYLGLDDAEDYIRDKFEDFQSAEKFLKKARIKRLNELAKYCSKEYAEDTNFVAEIKAIQHLQNPIEEKQIQAKVNEISSQDIPDGCKIIACINECKNNIEQSQNAKIKKAWQERLTLLLHEAETTYRERDDVQKFFYEEDIKRKRVEEEMRQKKIEEARINAEKQAQEAHDKKVSKIFWWTWFGSVVLAFILEHFLVEGFWMSLLVIVLIIIAAYIAMLIYATKLK